jgi:hypothetical protein
MLEKNKKYIDNPQDLKVIKCLSDIQIQDVWDDINVDLFKEWFYSDCDFSQVMFNRGELEELVKNITNDLSCDFKIAIELKKIIHALDLNDATMLLIFDKP